MPAPARTRRPVDIDKARTRRARATVRKSRKITSLTSVPTHATAQAALVDYDEAFLHCRDLGHTWTVQGYFRSGPEVRRRLVCQTCETPATDVWRPTGERIARRYNYVNGYLITGSGITRTDVRAEQLRRVTVFPNEQAMIESLFTNGRKRRG